MQNVTFKSPMDNTQKPETVSDKYTLINTKALTDIATNRGFKVASIRYPRYSKNPEYSRHIVKLDLPGYDTTKAYRPQLIIDNSHNGKSSLRIMAGVFRLVCSNGLIAGESTLNIRLRHVGLIQSDIEKQLDIAAKQALSLAPLVEKFQSVELNETQRRDFYLEALKIKAKIHGLSELETIELLSETNIARIRRVRRLDDQKNNLWEVFNRVQENSIKSVGLKYFSHKDAKYHNLRSVNDFSRNIKLNQQLWELAEKFAA